MDPQRWDLIRATFDLLAELDTAERTRRLAVIAADDAELGDAVESLLAADGDADSWLQSIESPLLPLTDSSLETGNSALPMPDPLGLTGRILSHFRVLEPLGAGGMGFVYRAEDTRLGRAVALKFPLPQHQLDTSAKQRFLHEARSAASLDHPNLCTIHEVGESEDGQIFMAMTLYPGETLKTRMAREGRLSIDQAVEIARQIARGLACAHAAGIVHRDLKPANVMLLPDGTVKILDFGLAKARDTGLTGSGELLGTPAYMAPEQIRGEPAEVRSDLWSLGVLLYEMIAGITPFGGEHGGSLVHAIVNAEPIPLTTARADTPASVEEIVGRLLRKAPSHRCPTADALLNELLITASHAEPLSQSARTGPHPEKTDHHSLPIWRLALLVAGAAFVGLALWATGVVPIPSKSPADGQPSVLRVAVFPFCVRSDANIEHWGEDLALLLGHSLDGLGELRQVDQNRLVTAAARESLGCRDAEGAGVIARRHGADLFVLGSLARAGGQLRADAWLYGPRDQDLTAVTFTVADESEIIALVDRLAREVAMAGLPEGSTNRLATATQTTASVDAMKAFMEGERRFREGGDAAEAFKRAVAIDTAFALAWLRLSWIRDASGAERAASVEAVARATRHAELLPPRERGFLAGWSAYLRGSIPEALELYRVHLGRYPDDLDAWSELGDVELHYGPLLGHTRTSAREPFERVLVDRPDDWQALNHLAWLASNEGLHSEADLLVERRLGGEQRGLMEATALAFRTGGPDEQRAVVSRLQQAGDLAMALIPPNAIRNHSPLGAERLLRVASEPSRSAGVRAMAHVNLAQLALMRGRWAAVDVELDSAAEFDPVSALEHRALLSSLPFIEVHRDDLEVLRAQLLRWDPQIQGGPSANPWISPHEGMHRHLRLYLIGLMNARLGNTRAAAAYADTLDTMPSPAEVPSLASNLASGVRAYAASTRGDQLAVLREVERIRVDIVFPYNHSSAFANHALERFLRAEALRAFGRHGEAMLWYEGFQEALNPAHWSYLGMVHFRLGDIYAGLGNYQAATAHFTWLMELWEDSDPEFRPLLEAARRRLARIEANN